MTILDDRPLSPSDDDPVVDEASTAAATSDAAEDRSDELAELRPIFVVGAAALAALAAAWMVGGLFRGGFTPRGIAAAGVALGVGIAYLSTRFPRGAVLQYAVVPAAAVLGAVFVAPSATGGTANLPGLVQEALRSGGLLQPPVPFEPGWRFILVMLLAVLSSAAVGFALSLRRPRLAVALPAPIVLGGALLQPEGTEVIASAVAGALLMGGMALAYGADLPRGEGASGTFEVRRLGRGAALMAVLIAAMALLSQAGFLFPEPEAEPVVPPRRPPQAPPEPDRVLFSVESTRPGPWRVGVLDGYDGEAFLLPPLDPERFVEVPRRGGGQIPGVIPAAGETESVTFTIADVRGGTLPGPAAPVAVEAGKDVEYDPRTGVLRLPTGRPPEGFRYSITTPVSPDAKALSSAPPPAAEIETEFTAVPPPPNEVVTLLDSAPTTNDFDRLQYVRQQLYLNVVAAGAGRPDEVTPARVGEMLTPGAEASPYEITAAEVLIARWAGIPSRLGFGFYGGEDAPGGEATSTATKDFRPKHGAAWLEAYFEGIGWVPLVGTPPKAKASLSDEEKRDDPAVSASQELALVVYVPVELETIELFYQRARAWASVALPLLALFGLLGAGWPIAAKALSRSRRHRWAVDRGPTARIWVAYADLRERAHDLNIGRVGLSPLEFVAKVAPDEEHEELAWLVTRAVWGDLRRDVNDEDAVAAEELSRSVRARLTRAQPVVNRVAAFVSRASLREPFDPALPRVAVGGATSDVPVVRAPRRAVPRDFRWRLMAPVRLGRRLARPRTAAVSLAVLVAVVAPALVPPPQPARAETPVELPEILPETALGYEFIREERLEASFAEPGDLALVSGGRVFTIRKGTVVAGSFQVAVLREDVDGRDRGVQAQIESTLQTGGFTTRRFGTVRLRTLRKAEQVLYVWFPPDRNVIELFVLRADVADGEQLVREVVRQQLELPLEAPQ